MTFKSEKEFEDYLVKIIDFVNKEYIQFQFTSYLGDGKVLFTRHYGGTYYMYVFTLQDDKLITFGKWNKHIFSSEGYDDPKEPTILEKIEAWVKEPHIKHPLFFFGYGGGLCRSPLFASEIPRSKPEDYYWNTPRSKWVKKGFIITDNIRTGVPYKVIEVYPDAGLLVHKVEDENPEDLFLPDYYEKTYHKIDSDIW